MFKRLAGWVCAVATVVTAHSVMAEDLPVTIGWLKVQIDLPPILSNLDPIPKDEGIMGARLGLADNATTGQFMGHDYVLDVQEVVPDGDALAAARALLTTTKLLVIDASANSLLSIADLPEAKEALIFNTRAGDSTLRDTQCRTNLLHTMPSDAMRADALMQFFAARRWTDLVMVRGTFDADIAFAEALTRSANKFRMRIRGEKIWDFNADMRRTASQEVPLFTQEFKDHDALLVADELHDFGRYIAYNTWLPRPVAGSEGLKPVAWSPVVEQWGAAQLQSRFTDLAGRDMRPADYAAWAAIRTIGEAVTRTNANDAKTLRNFILSDEFELAGFKGRAMNYRPWNGQLRQPIPLVTDRAVVAQAPLPGYLHQRTELDTLGIDRPESQCEAFQ